MKVRELGLVPVNYPNSTYLRSYHQLSLSLSSRNGGNASVTVREIYTTWDGVGGEKDRWKHKWVCAHYSNPTNWDPTRYWVVFFNLVSTLWKRKREIEMRARGCNPCPTSSDPTANGFFMTRNPKPDSLPFSSTSHCPKKMRQRKDIIYLRQWLYIGGYRVKVNSNSAKAFGGQTVSVVLCNGGCSIFEGVGFSGD